MCKLRPIKWYHFQADLIWPDSPFRYHTLFRRYIFHISDYLLRDSCGLEIKISKPDSTVGSHISGIASDQNSGRCERSLSRFQRLNLQLREVVILHMRVAQCQKLIVSFHAILIVTHI